jgi:rRNA-processing protein FCF1
MPVIIVIDTSFIVIPAQFGIDIFTEAEKVLERKVQFEILSCVVAEIDSLLEHASRTEQRWFRIARDFVDRCKIIDYKPTRQGMSVDDQILDYLVETGYVLATNDKELKKQARKRGRAVLMLRGKKTLMLEGVTS